MERNLTKAAQYLGTTRPKLIKLMRAKGLIDEQNLPTFPTRDREYLGIKESKWWHPKFGMQYSRSARVKQLGLHWLAAQLGLPLPEIPADRRDVA